MVLLIVSFLVSVLTAVQAVLAYTQEKGLCFNGGCEIVESLTTVPPFYFNVAGFLFFQTLFWCFFLGRNGSEYWHKFAKLLLLGGIVAEAVLVFFQYSIVAVFCSYCLIVFSCLVVLNLFCGVRQSFRATVLFGAVLVALFSLQFKTTASSVKSLDEGSCAQVSGNEQEGRLYVFFSSTCVHCEKVIEAIKEENNCTIRFNPIERIDDFQLPGAKQYVEYDPEINIGFLKNLTISEVPVLVARNAEGALVFTGAARIIEYLSENCREKADPDYSGSTTGESGYTDLSFTAQPGDDSCGVDVDCAVEEPEPL